MGNSDLRGLFLSVPSLRDVEPGAAQESNSENQRVLSNSKM